MKRHDLVHPFGPIFDEKSEILILGTFPSVMSRENSFFYGHPQNRFWRVISGILKADEPHSIEEKKSLLLENGIALWDVIHSCTIEGSSDSSIKGVVANDLSMIFNNCRIKRIYANGKTAQRLYNRYILPRTGREIIALPSTSPANAAYSVERLIQLWSCILK